MSQNLLSFLQGQLAGDTVSQLSSFLGEPPAQTSGAVSAGMQALLGAMTQKAASPQGAGDLIGMLNRVTGDNSLGNVASLLSGGSHTADIAKLGAPLVASLLGGQQNGVISWLASAAGIGQASAGSLLSLLTPLILGGISRYLTSSGSGVNASALSNLFSSQSASLLASAPTGLAGALGVSSLADLTRGPKVVARPVEDTDTGLGFLKWVLPLLALAALLAYMMSRRSTVEDAASVAADNAANAAGSVASAANSAADTAAAATANAANAVKDAAASLGAMVERSLPNLPSIRVPENGIESKLLAFITDASRPVDTTTWFSFDRLEFDTASATLKPGSNEQLDAIAAILKAYPRVSIKIGGYTDNVGDDAANLKLSAARAETTRSALVERGVVASRLDAEGFGEQFPVASNETEEGRQRNRRIDVRVTRK